MNEYEVNARKREQTGKGAMRRMRRTGFIPGVLYGAGKDPENLLIEVRELRKQLENEAFFSHILNVKVDGQGTQAVLKALQRDPASYQVTHADFLRVKATEQITMRVPLHFMNEETCPGRKEGGVVNHLIVDLEINCLPKDLPEYIEVDIGALELGGSVHMSELVLPEGVSMATSIEAADHDHTVVAVQMPQALEVEEAEGEEGLEDVEGAADTAGSEED